MDDLLFLSQRIPYPPNKGDKVRSWNALRRLAKLYRVHLGCFVDNPDDWQYRDTVAEICAGVCLVPLRPGLAKLRALPALVSGQSLSERYFASPRMRGWIDGVRRQNDIARVFVFSSGMASYVMGRDWSRTRRVLDMVDVDSDKWRQYAARRGGVSAWLYRREAARLLDLERRAAGIFDATLLVSDHEAALFRELAPESADRIHAIANGVDAEFFDPGAPYDDPYGEAGSEVGGERAAVIAFTGAMDYWPNIDAARWFADCVLPRLQNGGRRHAFYIVGANPSREVLALAERPGITVTGRVPDIRPYLAHADVVVAPLRIARGIQNKVLEGMAMGRPVIASPQALAGLEAMPDKDLLVAEEPAEFARAIKMVTSEGADEIAASGRNCVVQRYSWDVGFSRLQGFLEV